MPEFNHAQIKREAHTLSRKARWNVFGHVWSDNARPSNNDRRNTWQGQNRDLERATDDNDTSSPIGHASTAPVHKSEADEAGSPTSMNGKKYGGDEKDGMRESQINSQSQGDSNYPSQTSSAPTAVEGEMRHRKTDAQSSDLTDGSHNSSKDGQKDKKEKKDRTFFKRVEPKEPFTFANQIKHTLLNSWINVLLIAVPLGIAFGATGKIPAIGVFVINFIAIIPLAAMLSFATEEIAMRTGETLGGLLNATFGNAVELIVAVLALKDDEIAIVQTSLIGSILSNLLLVMGMCFFFGGLRRQEQFFNTTVAQTAASILALAIAGIIIPTVFDLETTLPESSVAALSRGVAVILLVVYGSYLFFQLKTHSEVFSAESQKTPKKPRKRKHGIKNGAVKLGLVNAGSSGSTTGAPSKTSHEVFRNNQDHHEQHGHEEEDEQEYPQLAFPVAIATLGLSTVFIAFCAEYLVNSIDTVTSSGGISKEFLGLILLPIVGNAAEHATAVTVAVKDKMDLAIGVAVGSSMQVALFIIPLLVVIGWGLGKDDMNLSFDVFQVAILFVSVLLVNYLIGDGKSHWLEGQLLMMLYLVIAVCSWYYPVAEPVG